MKSDSTYPQLNAADLVSTRNTLHDCAKVLGRWLKHNRDKRKHWWHASLRPTLNGFGTGVIHANIDFELQINLRNGTLDIQTNDGSHLKNALIGNHSGALAHRIEEFLNSAGLDSDCIPKPAVDESEDHGTYSSDTARKMWQTLNCVSAAMETFRAATREENSPVQLWPHHFDLSLLWLPGGLVVGQDPKDEENSDQQMNFGFVFGDAAIPEPYFYVTAYPFPDDLQTVSLPSGATWQSQGFNGAAVTYDWVQNCADPHQYLLQFWTTLQTAGRERFAAS